MSSGTMQERQAAYRLAGEVGCDPRTALAWLRGSDIQPAVAYALEAAAAKLGITRGNAPVE